MFRYFFALVFSVFFTGAYAANVSGIVKNTRGERLPYTSVIIRGTTTGTMANADGVYTLSLSPGQYELVFQFLGYKTLTKTVTIADENVKQDVTMEEQSFNLAEVKVQKGNEDPANAIMRKAIAKSKIHNLQVTAYETNTYIKNTLLLNNIPAIARKELAKEGIRIGIPVISESKLVFSFKQPNKRFTRVIAKKSSSIDNVISTSDDFYLINFYEPVMSDDIISPLSPSAFSYYNFEYLGYFEDRGVTVNRISVIPKNYGPGVWRGVIYIIEDQWNIHSADVETVLSGMKYKINQLYAPSKGVWMPVNQKLELSGKIFGFDFQAQSQVSPEYTLLEVNPRLVKEVKIIDEKSQGTVTAGTLPKGKTSGEILEVQKEFSVKEMNKLMKSLEKEEKKERENKLLTRHDSLVVDSLANSRSAAFWNEARTIPLTAHEARGYRFTDSLKVIRIEKKDSLEKDSLKKNWKKFAFGYDFKLKSADKTGGGLFLKYKPPFIPLIGLNYNTVEGMTANLGLSLQKKKSDQVPAALTYSVATDLRYAVGLRRWQGRAEGKVMKKGQGLLLGAGSYKAQFDGAGGIGDDLNTLTTFFGLNIAKIYMKDYFHIGYLFEKDRKFSFMTDLELAGRSPLVNLQDGSRIWIRNKKFTSNIPVNFELEDSVFSRHQSAIWSTVVKWQPGLRYRLYNGRKIYQGSDWPAFTATYRKGMNGVDYDFLSLSAAQQINTRWAGKLNYFIEAGDFVNDRRVYLMDMKHLNSINLTTDGSRPDHVFAYYRQLNTNLPIQLSSDSYYKYSTKGAFLKAHVINEFKSLLITQSTLARMYGLKEDLFVNYLNSPIKKNYVELGYGIDGIGKIVRVEVITSFEQGKFQRWGWQIGATF